MWLFFTKTGRPVFRTMARDELICRTIVIADLPKSISEGGSVKEIKILIKEGEGWIPFASDGD